MARNAAQGIDLSSRSVRVAGPDGTEQHLGYDLLVGADGSNSVVRGALADAVRPSTVLLCVSVVVTSVVGRCGHRPSGR